MDDYVHMQAYAFSKLRAKSDAYDQDAAAARHEALLEHLENVERALGIASTALVGIYAVLEYHELTDLPIRFEDQEVKTLEQVYRRAMEFVRPANVAISARRPEAADGD